MTKSENLLHSKNLRGEFRLWKRKHNSGESKFSPAKIRRKYESVIHKDIMFKNLHKKNLESPESNMLYQSQKLFGGVLDAVAVSYTHLTLPTNREV